MFKLIHKARNGCYTFEFDTIEKLKAKSDEILIHYLRYKINRHCDENGVLEYVEIITDPYILDPKFWDIDFSPEFKYWANLY